MLTYNVKMFTYVELYIYIYQKIILLKIGVPIFRCWLKFNSIRAFCNHDIV